VIDSLLEEPGLFDDEEDNFEIESESAEGS
jgi:hypothetical protein